MSYFDYLIPLALLFTSIIVFRFVFKKIARVEGFQEKSKTVAPVPNDQGVKLLYEIRGMMLNNQNEIDKQIEALTDKKDSSVVLDKMSELEDLLKGVRPMTVDIEPKINLDEPDDELDDKEDDNGKQDDQDGDANDDEKIKVNKKGKGNDKVKGDGNETLDKQLQKQKKSSPSIKKKLNPKLEQPVDESSDDEAEEQGYVEESFVDGIEYSNSAMNCYEVN